MFFRLIRGDGRDEHYGIWGIDCCLAVVEENCVVLKERLEQPVALEESLDLVEDTFKLRWVPMPDNACFVEVDGSVGACCKLIFG